MKSQQVSHGDISSGNIMIEMKSRGEQIHIVDFDSFYTPEISNLAVGTPVILIGSIQNTSRAIFPQRRKSGFLSTFINGHHMMRLLKIRQYMTGLHQWIRMVPVY